MKPTVNKVLYRKKGVTISNLAMDLLSKSAGDRIPPISYYQQEFRVSRGTMQNAFTYLQNIGAVVLTHHGHQGTYIESMDYGKLQENCVQQKILGIMPLPYSLTYEGFATAIYEQLNSLKFNMAYARGAVGRIELVESGTYQFAVVSQYAAQYAIDSGRDIKILEDFGPGSFLSRHVLLLKDPDAEGIQDGMRVAYDDDSLDQSKITSNVIKGHQVKLVNLRTQQTVAALHADVIDAGICNYDDIVENHHLGNLKMISLVDRGYNHLFSTAVIIIRKGNVYLEELMRKKITVENTLRILDEVRSAKEEPYY